MSLYERIIMTAARLLAEKGEVTLFALITSVRSQYREDNDWIGLAHLRDAIRMLVGSGYMNHKHEPTVKALGRWGDLS